MTHPQAPRGAPRRPDMALRTSATLRHEPAAPWRWAALGALLGALLATAVWAPARWLADGLHSATGGQVQLRDARGTVWNGSAAVVLASGAGGEDRMALPGRMHWQLRPAWLGVRGQLELACCTQGPLGFSAGPAGAGGLRLAWDDGRSRWPAAMLTGLGAPWNTLKLDGLLDLQTRGFVLRWSQGQLAMDGRAVLDAAGLSSSLSTLRPMGSYRLVLDGGPSPSLLLTTTDGALRLSGSGRWTGRAMRFGGEASAAPGSEDALANLLNIMGRREGARSIINLG